MSALATKVTVIPSSFRDSGARGLPSAAAASEVSEALPPVAAAAGASLGAEGALTRRPSRMGS